MSHGMAKPSAAIAIDYIEFPATDVAAAKKFYSNVFGWTFQDFGDDYASFNCGNLTGGFTTHATVARGGALVVLFAKDLTAMQRKVVDAGGGISREIFEFPGGRRFHFTDISGNELAVWSDQ